jgi:hypothetical protein
MIWDLLGAINGKTLLVAIIAGVVGFVLTVRPGNGDEE